MMAVGVEAGVADQKPVRFAASWAEVLADDAARLFSPVMQGLPVGLASALAAMPIHDANAMLLSALDMPASAGGQLCAGVLAIDPFRSWERIFTALHRARIRSVMNWPSVGVFDDDLHHALGPAQLGYDREVAFVRAAAQHGWRVTATVFSVAQAASMLEAGASRLLIHPPLNAIADPLAPPALELVAAITALAGTSPIETTLLYAERAMPDEPPRPPGACGLALYAGGKARPVSEPSC